MVPLKVIPACVTESGHIEDCRWDGAAASSAVDPVDSRRWLSFSTGVTSPLLKTVSVLTLLASRSNVISNWSGNDEMC